MNDDNDTSEIEQLKARIAALREALEHMRGKNAEVTPPASWSAWDGRRDIDGWLRWEKYVSRTAIDALKADDEAAQS